MSRLSAGGLIDRSRPLSFRFDGQIYQGFEGDTLASALLANDVRLVGRSFKYHRPRGVLTAGSEEPNALVTLRTGARAEPNTRATTIALFDGLEAASQNRWPSLALDVMAVNQLASPLLIAGFYYKTFMWPAKLWERLYEPVIRRAAGLGALSMQPDPDAYDRGHAFCDLLIVGGGPAGLAGALTAARAGLRVILAEQDWRLGGRLLSERLAVDDQAGVDWVQTVTQELQQAPNVRILRRTAVFGAYDGQEYGAIEQVADHLPEPLEGQPRQRLWKIVAKRAFLATGAIERPIVFGGNDKPGVMLASAVSSYVNRFAVSPGRRTVVFTTTDSGWQTALDLLDAGCTLAAVVEARPQGPALASRRLQAAGVEVFAGAVVADAVGGLVSSVEVRMSDGARRKIRADALAVAGGWNPAIGIGSNLGGRPTWSDALNTFTLDAIPSGLRTVGAAAGRFSLGLGLQDGVEAAVKVAVDLGRPTRSPPRFRAEDEPAGASPLWHVGASAGPAFVDFQNDVTDKDIKLAAREGFTSIEHLKRYTTLGMATDQGKTGQLNAHALMAAATGKSVAEAGVILSRPPYLPVAIGTFAGRHRGTHFRPVRKTASHQWAVEQSATFVDVGQWKRAQWYTQPGDRDWQATVNREVQAVRGGVGVCDISTLGKIDVHGPDAAILLDKLYANSMSNLAEGRTRYGLMLREDGMVLDDGTATRVGPNCFFVTTTTANAGRVMQHIDYARQVLWPELDVQATSVTEQWATYAIAGPHSRHLLQTLLPALELSNEGFPFMAATEFSWSGDRARLVRVSFSGELAYELSVPAHRGAELVRALFAFGAEISVTPYGAEALGVMRIEKGHPAGNELNGTTTAQDIGLGRMVSTKKDFIGRVMAARPGLTDPARPSLVGLTPVRPQDRLRGGAHILPKDGAPTAANDQGYVTSAAFSPTLDHSIALALVSGGLSRLGERVIAHDPVRSGDIEVEICDPVFIDKEGVRVRA